MKSKTSSFILFMLLICVAVGNEVVTNADEKNTITMTPDKPLLLQCNFTTLHGEVVIKWSHNGSPIPDGGNDYIKINKEENSLRIEKAKEDRDVGCYDCVADIPNQHVNGTICVQTKTRIEPFPKSLNLVQGDKLTLICKVKGYPPPEITWYKGSVDLMNDTEASQRIKFMTDDSNKNNIKAAKLIIEELEYEDMGQYTCEAQSVVNSDNATILVRVKDKLAALWPFLGICAEVAILCTIIFVYEKKRVKPDFDESDTDHTTENKNVQDQKEGGQDVRQRK